MRAAFFIVSLFCCVTMDTGVFARLAGTAENFCLLTEQVSCETVVERKKDSQQISSLYLLTNKLWYGDCGYRAGVSLALSIE